MTTPYFSIFSAGRNTKTSSDFGDGFRLLATLLRQTDADWELFLVDDASDDGTVEWMGLPPDPRITLIANTERVGKVANFMRVLPLMRGDVICEFDSDDWLASDTALAEIRTAYADSTVGATSGLHRVADSNLVEGGFDEQSPPRLFKNWWRSYAPRTWRRAISLRAMAEIPHVFHANFAVANPYWPSAGDVAIFAPAIHYAERFVSLGSVVYIVNPHAYRDADVDGALQQASWKRLLQLWAALEGV